MLSPIPAQELSAQHPDLHDLHVHDRHANDHVNGRDHDHGHDRQR